MYNMIQLHITVCLGQYSHKPRHLHLYNNLKHYYTVIYNLKENTLDQNICTVPLGGIFDHNHRLFLTTDAMLCIFRVSAYLLLGLLTLLDLQSVVVSLVVSCGLSGTCTGPGGFATETLGMALLLSPDPVGLWGLSFSWMTGCGSDTHLGSLVGVGAQVVVVQAVVH